MVHMTTVVKREFENSHHKCVGCGELRPKEDYTNPLGQSRGICDHCNSAFLGAEDLKNIMMIVLYVMQRKIKRNGMIILRNQTNGMMIK